MLDFQKVTLAFARWTLQQKRLRRPQGLYIVGVNGSVGQGKTVFSQALVQHLNRLLKPAEGQALTRSLDDYYLSKAVRYRPQFLSRGYNPKGIPNRGPAGTHDTARLWQDIHALEVSHAGSVTQLPIFDKQRDDRAAEPFRVHGLVGIFILEGWFVGARTQVDPMKAPDGLKRSVAAALKDYRQIFGRLDALWAFEPPASLEDVIAQRIEQQQTLDHETGRSGMTPAQIHRFIDYFYKDSWSEGVTSPFPPKDAVSFSALTDSRHCFLKISPTLL